MKALVEPEETVSGVGVYTPGSDTLECDAARLTAEGLSKVGHSIKRLIIHVHDASVLAEALSVSPDTVRELHIEYHCTKTFNNLKWALADLNMVNLDLLTVSGLRLAVWQADCLYALYPLPTIEVGGITHNPPAQEAGERIQEGEHWYRRFGESAAVQIAHLPFLNIEAKHLIVDCDNQFHPKHYPVDGVETLTLMGVMASADELFRFVDRFNGKGLYVTSLDPQLIRFENALSIRLRWRGIEFFMEV